MFEEFSQLLSPRLVFNQQIKVTFAKDYLKEMKFTLRREQTLDHDQNFQKHYQNVGFFFNQPDSFIMLFKLTGNESEK